MANASRALAALIGLVAWPASMLSAASPPLPDPTHITFTLPKDIRWEGDPVNGPLQAKLFGDPEKAGLYGILIKWLPGHYSHPHFHNTDRYALVLSGTHHLIKGRSNLSDASLAFNPELPYSFYPDVVVGIAPLTRSAPRPQTRSVGETFHTIG